MKNVTHGILVYILTFFNGAVVVNFLKLALPKLT